MAWYPKSPLPAPLSSETYNQQQSLSSNTSRAEKLPLYAYIFFVLFLICMWTAVLFPTVVHFFPHIVSHGFHMNHDMGGNNSHHDMNSLHPSWVSDTDNTHQSTGAEMGDINKDSQLYHTHINNDNFQMSEKMNHSQTNNSMEMNKINMNHTNSSEMNQREQYQMSDSSPMLLVNVSKNNTDKSKINNDSTHQSVMSTLISDTVTQTELPTAIMVTMVTMVTETLRSNTTHCADYTGDVCTSEFSQIAPTSTSVEIHDTFISSVSAHLKAMYQSGSGMEECYNATLRYLCRSQFTQCPKLGGAEEVVTLRETLVERCPTNYTGDMDSMLLRREDAGENTDTPSKGVCSGPTREVNGTCLLLCSWDAFPPVSQTANSIVMGVALAVSTLSCGIILISYMQITVMFTAGAVNYYIMLADITPWNILEGSKIFYNEKKFPHVIPIYISMCSMTSVWIVGIPVIVGSHIYCSQRFIIRQDEYSGSLFCTIQGFMFQYCIIAQSKWFCCLVYNIYQATVSTQKFSSNDQMMRRLHIIQSSICWVLPLVLCCIGLSHEGYGNHHGNKQVCVLKNKNMHYYTLVLPVQISTLLSATLLSFSVFFMKRSEIKSHSAVSRKRSMALGQKHPIHIVNKIEKKLMGLSASFVILNASLLTRLTFCIHQRVDLDNALKEYTACLGDITKITCPTTTYIHFLHPEVSIICNMVLGLYPAVVLIFLPSNKLLLVLWRKRVFELLGLLGLSNQSVSDFSNLRFSESVTRVRRGITRKIKAWSSLSTILSNKFLTCDHWYIWSGPQQNALMIILGSYSVQ